MRMSTQIPAMVQTPDLAGTIMRGREMQMAMQEAQNRNALAGYIRENGAGIMAGDTNALAGLAAYDPAMALGIQRQNKQDAREERDYGLREKQINAGMANDVARLDLARQQAAQQAAEHGARMSAYEREATAAEIQRKGTMAAAAYQSGAEAWDAFRASDAGKDFAPFDYKTAPIGIAGARGTLDGLGLGPREPLSPEGKLAADVQAGLVSPEAANPYDTEAESGLRKEWTSLPQVKDFQAQTTAMGRITAAAKDPSAAGDLALIFSFMKLLDPTSVVRETEFANAQNAAGVPDQIRNVYNRVVSGERLNPDQRNDFVSQSAKLYRDAEAQVGSLRKQYEGIAGAQNLDIGRTLPNFGYAGELPPERPSMAEGAPPQGIDPEIWGVMTPEERSLWQN